MAKVGHRADLRYQGSRGLIPTGERGRTTKSKLQKRETKDYEP